MIPSDFTVIVGAVVIAVVVLIAGSWLWKRLRPTQNPVVSTPPPCRVTLIPDEHPSWRGEKHVQRYMEQFRTLGFQRIGVFRIPELDSQRILALFCPNQKFYACIYDSKTNPTFEIFAIFSSANSLMGTNGSWVRDIEQRPGNATVRVANASPAQVLEVLRQHEKASERSALGPDGFVPAFLKAYIQNFNWRLKRTEISRDQIRMEGRQEGRTLTPGQVEDLYRAKRASYVAQLQHACRAQFRDDRGIDRQDWERLKNRLVAVPETYDLKEVINAVSYAVPSALNEKQLFVLQRVETSLGDDGIVLIEKIMAKNIGDVGLKKIGDVTEPVRAWIVVAQDVDTESIPQLHPLQKKAAA